MSRHFDEPKKFGRANAKCMINMKFLHKTFAPKTLQTSAKLFSLFVMHHAWHKQGPHASISAKKNVQFADHVGDYMISNDTAICAAGTRAHTITNVMHPQARTTGASDGACS